MNKLEVKVLCNKDPKENSGNKIKTINPKIIVEMRKRGPYYSIEYYDLSDNQIHIGYSSYELKCVQEWLEECFEIVKIDYKTSKKIHVRKKKEINSKVCGEWVYTWSWDDFSNEYKYLCTCSICNDFIYTDLKLDWKFCKNCGAGMRVEQ